MSDIHTEAQILSVDRVLNFFSVESSLFQEYFLLFLCVCLLFKDGLLKVKTECAAARLAHVEQQKEKPAKKQL